MAATDVTRGDTRPGNNASHDTPSFGDRARRLMTETKAATKTTEFFMVVAAVVGHPRQRDADQGRRHRRHR